MYRVSSAGASWRRRRQGYTSKRFSAHSHSLIAGEPRAQPSRTFGPPERVVIRGVGAPRSYAFREMPRRSLLAALAACLVALVPASAHAATAPANAPVLASAVFASPVAIQWVPGNDPFNISQSVLRAPGPCTSPASGGQNRQTFTDNT